MGASKQCIFSNILALEIIVYTTHDLGVIYECPKMRYFNNKTLEYCLVVGYPYLFMDLAARWLNFGLLVNYYTWTLMAVVGGARWLVIVNNYVNSGYA